MRDDESCRAFAEAMSRYFARLAATEQGEWWETGRAAAEAWAGALGSGGARGTAELAALDRLMAAGEGETGSAWIELRMRYGGWRSRDPG